MKKTTLALILATACGLSACGGGGDGGTPAANSNDKPVVVTPPDVDDSIGGILDSTLGNDEATLKVFVTDKNSNPVTGLTVEDFSVSLSNVDINANITGVSAALENQKDPFSASLLIDESHSMRESDPKDYRIHAARSFIDTLDSGETIQLFAFASGELVEHVFMPANLYRVTHSFVNSLNFAEYSDLTFQEGGVTNFYDAALWAIGITAAESPSANRTIIMFTDGRDNVSTGTAEDVIAQANANGIAVYVVGLGDDVEIDVLTNIAKQTGGTYIHAESADQLNSIFESLDEVLNGTAAVYEITIKLVGDLDTAEGTEGILRVNIPDSEVVEVPFVL